ncbi:MAG TPA: extracellular solute-binding protein [Nocardioidaceae bacterium]|nr:extracellular solute-binding protein [Nocardioidaceae bacterium]
MGLPDSPVSAQGLSRRGLLKRAGVLAAAGVASACGGAGLADTGSGATEVKFWNLFGGGDGARLLTLQDAFRKAHPHIAFESVTLQWGPPYYTKLSMAAAGGRAPDLAVLHLARLPGFAPGRLLDPIPMDVLEELGVSGQQLEQGLWSRCFHDGQLYAVPLDTHPFVMYYNTEICEKAGLLDSAGKLKPLVGEQAFTAALQRAKPHAPGLALALEGNGTGPWRQWWSLYRQLGGQLLDETGQRLVVDRDKAVRALEFLRGMVDSGLTAGSLNDDAVVAVFGSGQSAFLWHGEWEVTTFLEQKTPFGMTRFPAVFGNGRAQADSHTFVLPHQSDRDPERTRAALEFVAFMLRHSLDWAKGGHIPAYLPVAESARYQSLEPQSDYSGVAEEVQLDPAAWFSGSASNLETEAGAAFSAALVGQLSPEEGLEQFLTAVQRFLDIPAPV